MRLISGDEFWVVNTPFIRKVKSKLLAQFPVDLLAQPVVSRLILSLR